jgi:uncharacterized membrane protein
MMEFDLLINMLTRWGHLLFGITWIGILYYFNFIQGGYFKSATPEGLADAKAKLAPSALWWFRWAAMFTFITGIILLENVYKIGLTDYMVIGAIMGTFMFLNVWLIIWPNQKIVLGMAEGDAAAAGGKALLASRTNTLFSAPMVFCMLAGPHYVGYSASGNLQNTGMLVALALIVLLELNAIFGKQGPIASVRGVIVSSLVLTGVMVAMLQMM